MRRTRTAGAALVPSRSFSSRLLPSLVLARTCACASPRLHLVESRAAPLRLCSGRVSGSPTRALHSTWTSHSHSLRTSPAACPPIASTPLPRRPLRTRQLRERVCPHIQYIPTCDAASLIRRIIRPICIVICCVVVTRRAAASLQQRQRQFACHSGGIDCSHWRVARIANQINRHCVTRAPRRVVPLRLTHLLPSPLLSSASCPLPCALRSVPFVRVLCPSPSRPSPSPCPLRVFVAQLRPMLPPELS